MTHTVTAMAQTHPHPADLDQKLLAECVAACLECAQTCTACADACLAEDMVADLRTCIRTDLDCADVCETTGRVLSRQTTPDLTVIRAVLQTCAQVCKACGDECARHAEMHEHCKVCAEACRRCEEACTNLLSSLG